jgi:membrane protease YdiL (CAAX protease family)
VKRGILATTEALLTVLAAGLLSLVLMTVGAGIFWVTFLGRPLGELLRLRAVVLEGGASPAGGDASMSLGVLAVGISIQAIVFAGVGLGMARFRVKPPDGPSTWTSAAALGLGIAGGIAAILGTIVISFVMALLGLEIREQPWIVALVQSDPRAMWILMPWTVVVGPLAEELFFRFYLFRFLSQQVGAGFGYAVSALTFGIIHFHPPAFPLYVFYGLLLAYVYRRTSRLLAPVAAHMFINLVGTATLVLTGGETGI